MRPSHLAALGASALLAACSNPCQDLGDRLCACVGAGTARDTCKQQIKNQLSDANPSGATEDFCSAKLGTCVVPASPPDIQFCEWINTADGKVACGLANPPASGDAAAPLLDLPAEPATAATPAPAGADATP